MRTFTTTELVRLSKLTRRQLQQLQEAGAIAPIHKSSQPGRGYTSIWSFMSVLAAAYAKTWWDLGFSAFGASWAAKWAGQQELDDLEREFAIGNVMLMPIDGGDGMLVSAFDDPEAPSTRSQKIARSELNLQRCLRRIQREVGMSVRAK